MSVSRRPANATESALPREPDVSPNSRYGVEHVDVDGPRRLVVFARAIPAERVDLVSDGDGGVVDPSRPALQPNGPTEHDFCSSSARIRR